MNYMWFSHFIDGQCLSFGQNKRAWVSYYVINSNAENFSTAAIIISKKLLMHLNLLKLTNHEKQCSSYTAIPGK